MVHDFTMSSLLPPKLHFSLPQKSWLKRTPPSKAAITTKQHNSQASQHWQQGPLPPKTSLLSSHKADRMQQDPSHSSPLPTKGGHLDVHTQASPFTSGKSKEKDKRDRDRNSAVSASIFHPSLLKLLSKDQDPANGNTFNSQGLQQRKQRHKATQCNPIPWSTPLSSPRLASAGTTAQQPQHMLETPPQKEPFLRHPVLTAVRNILIHLPYLVNAQHPGLGWGKTETCKIQKIFGKTENRIHGGNWQIREKSHAAPSKHSPTHHRDHRCIGIQPRDTTKPEASNQATRD